MIWCFATRYGAFYETSLHRTMLTVSRDTIAQRPDFIDGTLDIDGLCQELRQKAKCSETGVVIDKKDVDAALSRRATGNSPTSL